MAILKCKMCGGDMELRTDQSVGECLFCGTISTFPKISDEKAANMFNRANHFRRLNDFDKAATAYEHILADDPQNAEAHWCVALCHFGIEYVEDPKSHERIPTCHRASNESIFADIDYRAAIDNADVIARDVYEAEARRIDEINQGILEISRSQEPFDVFICYKETSETNQRTKDSVQAEEVYEALTDKGLRVFFARITLESMLGKAYEPLIFAALNSAKVMLVFGSREEYFQATWVKNEWSRYLSLMGKDSSRTLIPIYIGMDAYLLPDEFAHLQAQDMNKIGAKQDLTRGVLKVLGRDKVAEQSTGETQALAAQALAAQAAVAQAASVASDLVEKGYEAFKTGKNGKACEQFEQALAKEPVNIGALYGMLVSTGNNVNQFAQYYEKISKLYPNITDSEKPWLRKLSNTEKGMKILLERLFVQQDYTRLMYIVRELTESFLANFPTEYWSYLFIDNTEKTEELIGAMLEVGLVIPRDFIELNDQVTSFGYEILQKAVDGRPKLLEIILKNYKQWENCRCCLIFEEDMADCFDEDMEILELACVDGFSSTESITFGGNLILGLVRIGIEQPEKKPHCLELLPLLHQSGVQLKNAYSVAQEWVWLWSEDSNSIDPLTFLLMLKEYDIASFFLNNGSHISALMGGATNIDNAKESEIIGCQILGEPWCDESVVTFLLEHNLYEGPLKSSNYWRSFYLEVAIRYALDEKSFKLLADNVEDINKHQSEYSISFGSYSQAGHRPYFSCKLSLLDFAVYLERKEAVAYLLQRGANPNSVITASKDNIHITLPLLAIAMLKNEETEVAELLLQYGADPNGVFKTSKPTTETDPYLPKAFAWEIPILAIAVLLRSCATRTQLLLSHQGDINCMTIVDIFGGKQQEKPQMTLTHSLVGLLFNDGSLLADHSEEDRTYIGRQGTINPKGNEYQEWVDRRKRMEEVNKWEELPVAMRPTGKSTPAEILKLLYQNGYKPNKVAYICRGTLRSIDWVSSKETPLSALYLLINAHHSFNNRNIDASFLPPMLEAGEDINEIVIHNYGINYEVPVYYCYYMKLASPEWTKYIMHYADPNIAIKWGEYCRIPISFAYLATSDTGKFYKLSNFKEKGEDQEKFIKCVVEILKCGKVNFNATVPKRYSGICARRTPFNQTTFGKYIKGTVFEQYLR